MTNRDLLSGLPKNHRAPASGLVRHARSSAATVAVLSLVAAGLAVTTNGASALVTGTTLVTDNFNRSVSGGWGTTDSGQTWALRGESARFAVDGAAATVTLRNDGRGKSVDLSGVNVTKADVQYSMTPGALASGNGLYINTVSRRVAGNGQYLAKLRLRAAGGVGLALARTGADGAEFALTQEISLKDIALAPSTRLAVNVRVEGTNPTRLFAKVWDLSTAEPADWQVSAQDSAAGLQVAGGIALNFYLSKSSTVSPVSPAIDDLVITSGTAPATPDTPTWTAGNGRVDVAWAAVAGAQSYRVSRDGVPVTTTNALTWTDSGLEPGETHNYSVAAVAGGLASADSQTVTASSIPRPSTPQAPTASATFTDASVTWAPVAGASGYRLYRNGELLAATPLTTYTDEDLTPGTVYSYAVSTTVNEIDSLISPVTEIATRPIPQGPEQVTAVAQESAVAVSWAGNPEATSYRLLRDGTPITTTESASVRDTNVAPARSYKYSVVTLIGKVVSRPSQPAAVVTPAPVPTGISAVPTSSNVALKWDSVADASGYDVLRDGIVVATVTANTFTDTKVNPTSTYEYRVRSTVNDVTSGASAPATVTVPAPPAPPAPVGPVRAADGAGSAPIGTTRYPVPANAIIVSPNGNDANAGTLASPLATVGRAVALATSGRTIVLRAGTYRERITVPSTKQLTFQNYPGEAAWFDGSAPVTGWVADGGAWKIDNWNAIFDNSPTYTRGAADSTAKHWGFINPAFPMAASPEQVWIDGVEQAQVASRTAVVPGTFFIDRTARRLVLGTSPAGKEVRAGVVQVALNIQGAGTVVRGIGFQRYSPSVPDMGAVIANAPRITLENIVVRDMATQGIFVGGRGVGDGITVRNVTADGNGLVGIAGTYADGLTISGIVANGNNAENFNTSPVSGGIKITRSRGVSITDSVMNGNNGPGLWLDESVYDGTVEGNNFVGNAGHGMSLEISAKMVVANNLISNSGVNGIKVNNTSDVKIWNNTIVNSAAKPLWIVQDSRQASNLSTPGHDPRQSLPDPTMTWRLGPVEVMNNVVSGTNSICLICVEDTALLRTAEQIGVTVSGNVWGRNSSTAPRWAFVWASGQANPKVYTSLAAFQSGTGQDRRGVEFVGSAPIDASGRITLASLRDNTTVPVPLPASIAAVTGRTAGESKIGAWLS